MVVKSNQDGIGDIIEGIRDGLLFIPLYLPIALAYAVLAEIAGLSSLKTVLWSAAVFAGMSQLASLNILMLGGGFFEVMITTLLVNLRHGFISLSLAPYSRGLSRKLLPIIGFTIATPSIGLIPARAEKKGSIKAYWLSTQICQYTQFVLFTLLGIWLGRMVPPDWKGVVSFAAPASYIGLTMPLLVSKPRAGLGVVLTASVTGLGLCFGMNPGLAVIIAATIGASVGLFIKERDNV